jgi:2-keto-3-deoxy-L-rhamnonate aldolase RhmA
MEKFTAANRRSTLFCQIETAEGVKNAEAIATLPGVDCLWVGHFDLSVSLGVSGEFGSKKFTDAIARVAAAAAKHCHSFWTAYSHADRERAVCRCPTELGRSLK